MFTNSIKYTVEITDYAQKYYGHSFLNKYHKKPWEATVTSIIESLQLIYNLEKESLKTLDKIFCSENTAIFKFDFKVAGTKESAKSSGNRCILHVCNETNNIEILLIYSKNDIVGNNETIWWKQKIKENFDYLVVQEMKL